MEDIKVVGLAPSKAGGKTNWKIISAIIGIIVLSVGVIAGIFLVRQQQDIREQAAGNCDNPESIVQCPRSDGALVSCTPPDSNGNAQISLCDSRFVGRTEVCGGTQYCCNGTAWGTDMSACSCDAKAPTGVTVADLTSTSATLKWSGATGGKLRLWVSKNADLSCSVADSCPANDLSITPVTTNEYALTNLTPNTKYYWRVIAWTKEGCDSGSSIVNFTTLATDATQSTATPTVTATVASAGGSTATPTVTATPTITSTPKMTATATSFSSKTATPTATSKAKTATPTVKSTASGSGTPMPIPETGADLPTVLGLSFGFVMILISLGLAL